MPELWAVEEDSSDTYMDADNPPAAVLDLINFKSGKHQIAQTGEVAYAQVVGKIAGANQAQNVQTEMSRYIEAHPDLKVEGSELRGRVLAEFGYQTQILGHQGKSAELAAVRAILGPLEKPKATIRVDTTREGYSGAGGSTNEGAGDTKVDLSQKERAYYQKHIGPGKLYKSWDEVNKMVGAHANPHIRTRHSNDPVI